MSKCIGIVGSRRRDTRDDFLKVTHAFLAVYEPGDTLVSGGCPSGGDKFAEQLAEQGGISIVIHRADWKGKGRSAGFQRNTFIAQDADVLIACVAADRTGGTEDTIRKFLRFGKTRLILV